MRKLTILAMFAALALFAFGFATQAAELPTVKWRLASVWTEGNTVLNIDRAYAERVKRYSGGKFIIDVYAAGEIVGPTQVFDAVQNGTVEMGADWPGYWSGRNTAFELLATSLDDFTSLDKLIWTYQAGGLELYKEIYAKFGLVGFPHAFSPTESGLRCKAELKGMPDLKGRKIRISGKIQGYVSEKIGYTPIALNAGDIYESLQRGVIDCAEFSGPESDESLKITEVAKYWMAPGWHQSEVTFGVFVGKKAWDSLPKEYQELLERAAMDSAAEWMHRQPWQDAVAANKMLDKDGVKVVRYSDDDLAKIRAWGLEGRAEMAKANPDYKKVIDHQDGYRKIIDRLRFLSSPYSWGFARSENLKDITPGAHKDLSR